MVLYGGRVEPDNGCEEMLEYFDAYAANDGETSLVLMGVKMLKVPDEPYVRQAGVLPDRERMVAYEAADVTIAPGIRRSSGAVRSRELRRRNASLACARMRRRSNIAVVPAQVSTTQTDRNSSRACAC
jgi:hypothetical protein